MKGKQKKVIRYKDKNDSSRPKTNNVNERDLENDDNDNVINCVWSR